MATTVTTGTVAAGIIPGFGLLALGGLALGALALSAKRSRGRGKGHGGGGYGHGGGGYGHGGGYGYGHGGHGGGYGYGHGRKRRSVDDEEKERQLLTNEIEAVRKADGAGCGLRLVCELGAVDEDELTEEEMAILAFVGPGMVKPGEGLLPYSSLWEYQASRVMGQAGANCAKAFPACPYDASNMVKAINDLLP